LKGKREGIREREREEKAAETWIRRVIDWSTVMREKE
jgi:hypothetical protein